MQGRTQNNTAGDDLSKQILAKIAEAQTNPVPENIMKAFTQPSTPTTGINAYDLTPAARILYPVITPIRNMLPRKANGVGTASNWRSITAINSANLSGGVQDGERGGILSTTVLSLSAPFAGLGFDDYATFEADFAAKTFDDVKALAVEGLLRSLMIYEEKTIIGGNTDQALGTTPTPTLTGSTTGGTLAALTYSVICVALTLEGFLSANKPINFVGGAINGQVTRSNADGTTTIYGGGSAQQSASATVTTTGSTSSIAATVTPVNGAMAYAWYVGAVGAEKLNQITTINSASITQLNSTGQLASAIPNAGADNSTNAYVFDGLISQISMSGSNSYIATLPTGVAGAGTTLTSSGAGTVNEIDFALETFWNNFNLAPTHLLVNAQEMRTIQKLVGGNGGQPIYRLNLNGNDANYEANAGFVVMSYVNPYTYAGNNVFKILLHPFVPPGTMIFYTDRLPYPLSNVSNPLEMKLRRDYYQIEWPIVTRKYQYGIYMDGLLQNYFPPAFGMITNIAKSA